MASNLDYLDPTLQPLEEKVEAYLAAERELRQLAIEAENEPRHDAEVAEAAQQFVQRPATGSFDQHHEELVQRREQAEDDRRRLSQEIMALLPARDEWVKVNLGYGPSRVGAWRVGDDYEIRVVQ